jgi:hypothetical protein
LFLDGVGKEFGAGSPGIEGIVIRFFQEKVVSIKKRCVSLQRRDAVRGTILKSLF